jgi:hypothetical protein
MDLVVPCRGFVETAPRTPNLQTALGVCSVLRISSVPSVSSVRESTDLEGFHKAYPNHS